MYDNMLVFFSTYTCFS